jgi:hypothetical protein
LWTKFTPKTLIQILERSILLADEKHEITPPHTHTHTHTHTQNTILEDETNLPQRFERRASAEERRTTTTTTRTTTNEWMDGWIDEGTKE